MKDWQLTVGGKVQEIADNMLRESSEGFAGNISAFDLKLPTADFHVGQKIIIRDVDGTPYPCIVKAITTDLRYVTPKKSRGTVIPAAVRQVVHDRDQGCVAVRAGFTDHVCFGGRELDHVRVGGTGLKSPSEPWNLVVLCAIGHREKTLHGRLWRPKLLAYLEGRQ